MVDYDAIGSTYAGTRRPDPRIAAQVVAALGEAESVLNVGAGAGSYEPADRRVVAVEPSVRMVRQRPLGSAPVVRAVAEFLPFDDGAFDAAMAILTVHHWSDVARGMAEMRRVSQGRLVVLTWDEALWEPFWLVRDYFPGMREVDRPRAVGVSELVERLGAATVVEVPVPFDCLDGFCGAFWRRPAAYLDPAVRAGISSFAMMGVGEVDEGLRRLAADLESGRWRERNVELLSLDHVDLGYRLIVSGS